MSDIVLPSISIRLEILSRLFNKYPKLIKGKKLYNREQFGLEFRQLYNEDLIEEGYPDTSYYSITDKGKQVYQQYISTIINQFP